MTNPDEFTESDLHEMASAVFDGEATEDERQFVADHSDGPALLASYDRIRSDVRAVEEPSEEAFAQLRSRAMAARTDQSAVSPPTGRQVTSLAGRRASRRIAPKLVGVAAVAVLGIGAVAIANLDRSSSNDSASTAMERSELSPATDGSAAEQSSPAPAAPGGADLAGDATPFLGSFESLDGLADAYRLGDPFSARSPESADGPNEGGGSQGSGETAQPTTGDDTDSGDNALKYGACGQGVARADVDERDVVLVAAGDGIDVLDAETCELIGTFAP